MTAQKYFFNTHPILFFAGQCAQAVRSGSSQFKACDLLIAASMISFLTFTSVFQIMLVLQSSPFIRSLRPSSSAADNSSRSRRHRRTNSTTSNNSFPSSAVAISRYSNASITTTSPHDFTSLTTFRTDTSSESETTNTQSAFISGGMTSRTPCSLVSR